MQAYGGKRGSCRLAGIGLGVALAVAAAGDALAEATAAEPASAAAATVAAAADPQLDQRIAVDLPAQSVSSAIIQLSKTANVQLLMSGEALSGLATAGLHGEMTLREALAQLLAGQRYSLRKVADDTVAIDIETPVAAAAAGNDTPTAVAGDTALEVIPVLPIIAESSEELSTSSAAERPGAQRLDDVIVTATKREKSSREVPVSITALRGEDLEKNGARDIRDYIMQAPGITMDDSEYGEASGRRMTIRGVGPGSGAYGNQTVGQFIGDAPLTDPYGNYGSPDLDPFDLKTVEILRGPQGTTFGASALNGAIRYVPNEPVLQEWSGRGFIDHTRLSEGDTGMSYGAAVNAPLGEQAALRVSGVLQDAPGLYDNLQRDERDSDSLEKWSARGALRWEPTERTSATLMFLKQRSHLNDVLVATNPDGRFENANKPGASYMDFEFSMANADLRHRLDDWGTLVYQYTRQTKLTSGNIDAGIAATGSQGIESLYANLSVDVEGSAHELRLVSPEGGRWDWIVGLFSRDYVAAVETLVGPTLAPGVIRGGIDPLNAKETAIFGELVRRFGEHWEATIGARRYDTRLDGQLASYYANVVPVYDVAIAQQEDGINPKFSLAWKADQNLMAYATIARGFQFGGVNAALELPVLSSFPNPVQNYLLGPPVPRTYTSSVLWNRELGLRTDWLDRSLRLDLAVFDIKWSKAQLQQQSGGAVYSNIYIDNVGEVSSRGVEGTFTWLTPLPGLSLNLLASYIRAVTTSEYQNGEVVVPSGTEMPAAPRVQTSTTLAYNTYFGSWITGASLTHAYWSHAYSDIYHSQDIYDFSTLGMSFNLARPDLPLRPALTLGIANLTDERGVVGRNVATSNVTANTANDPASGAYWRYIRPRSISLRLTAEFD